MELNRAVAENIKRIRKTKKLSMERTAELAGARSSGGRPIPLWPFWARSPQR